MEWTSEVFEVRRTVWDLIKEKCWPEELNEVKFLLGSSLIEEIDDLRREVDMLLDIWRDCRSSSELEPGIVQNQRLPEPPQVRENLTRQIKLFMKLLKEKSSKSEREIMRELTTEHSTVLDKVLQEDRKWVTRPNSALSARDGRETPIRAVPVENNSRPSSSLSDYTIVLDEEMLMQKIDEIAEQLREELCQDKTALESDIAFLQGCVMEEADYKRTSHDKLQREPTLKELQDVGMLLEKKILNKEANTDKSSRYNSISRKTPRKEIKTLNRERTAPSSPSSKNTSASLPAGRSSDPPTSCNTKKYPVKVVLLPSPPSSAKPDNLRRPSSGAAASRFRRMVLECRDSTV